MRPSRSSGLGVFVHRLLKLFATFVVAAFALVAAPASAQLAIDRLWVDFEPGDPKRADIVIRNESQDRYYISVSPVEIAAAGEDSEARSQISDPEQLGLLVSPNRLIVEPGGLRSIRLVSLNGALEKDRVYRVKVSPQVGEIETADPGAGNRGVSVKLLTAYDLLVTARPPKPVAKIITRRDGNTLTIVNEGNTNTLLFEGRACPAGAKPYDAAVASAPTTASSDNATPAAPVSVCADIGARRMYAGNQWVVELPTGTERIFFKERVLASADPREIEFR